MLLNVVYLKKILISFFFQVDIQSPKNVRPVLTARGSGLDFGSDEMEPDLVRGTGSRKSVPEPIWPHSGKVANQVKVFNEKLSPKTSQPDESTRNVGVDLSNEIEICARARTPIVQKKPIPDLRRFSTSHYQPTRDMSPIGECPSHDETEEERKFGNNDSIVTEALLRMTGKTGTAHSQGHITVPSTSCNTGLYFAICEKNKNFSLEAE